MKNFLLLILFSLCLPLSPAAVSQTNLSEVESEPVYSDINRSSQTPWPKIEQLPRNTSTQFNFPIETRPGDYSTTTCYDYSGDFKFKVGEVAHYCYYSNQGYRGRTSDHACKIRIEKIPNQDERCDPEHPNAYVDPSLKQLSYDISFLSCINNAGDYQIGHIKAVSPYRLRTTRSGCFD